MFLSQSADLREIPRVHNTLPVFLAALLQRPYHVTEPSREPSMEHDANFAVLTGNNT
jgi:hypothetical protein